MVPASTWSPLARSLLDRARACSRDEFVKAFPDRVLLIPVGGLIKDVTSRGTTKLKLNELKKDDREGALPFDVALLRKVSLSSRASNLLTLGRSSNTDIVISHLEVSKVHAFFMIDTTTGQVTISDAGSTNGTKVHGRQLVPKVEAEPIRGGDELWIGTVKVIYHEPGTFYEFLRSFDERPVDPLR